MNFKRHQKHIHGVPDHYNHSGGSIGIRTRSVSKSSINCSFMTLTFVPAKRRYSSKMDVRFQCWSFLKHPTTVPNSVGWITINTVSVKFHDKPVWWRPKLQAISMGECLAGFNKILKASRTIYIYDGVNCTINKWLIHRRPEVHIERLFNSVVHHSAMICDPSRTSSEMNSRCAPICDDEPKW